jgi:fumarate reductase flavoprotein subunit
VVHLDLRHLGAKLINAKLPFVRELCMKYENIDPVKELIPVRPVVHYMMGGVSTDIHGATPLDGLFAAGEAACVSINGANRLGSNSLTECLVFGARAGQAAAEFAVGKDVPDRGVLAQATDEQHRLVRQYLHKSGGKERIATLREEMQKAVESGAGIYREQATLAQAGNKLRELQERYLNINLDDHSQTTSSAGLSPAAAVVEDGTR